MGAIGYFRSVSPAFARRLHEDRELLDEALLIESIGGLNIDEVASDLLANLDKFPPEMRQNLESLAAPRRTNTKSERGGAAESELDAALELGKVGTLLEELLASSTDDASPARIVVVGGTPISEDLGYGPAFLIDAESVQRAAAALAAIPEAAIVSPPADPAQVEIARKIHDSWVRAAKSLPSGLPPPQPSSGDSLRDLFIRVRDYFQAASAQGKCMLRWFT